MKESKKQVEEALIIVGESLGIKKSVELLLINVGLHSTVREITYKIFTENKQDYFESDDKVFDSLQLIRTYCKEMSKNGEVNFEIPYSHNAK